MRKHEIEDLKFNDHIQAMEDRLEAKGIAINGISLLEEFSLYRNELEKARVEELKERIDKLDEATIAYHASNKGLANRALMIKQIIEGDEVGSIDQMELENETIIKKIKADFKAEEEARLNKEKAKQYLKEISKSEITTLTKAKEMLWHLKNLTETE